jgi:hypothetical protein
MSRTRAMAAGWITLALLGGCAAAPWTQTTGEPAILMSAFPDPAPAPAGPIRLGAGDELGRMVYEHALLVARNESGARGLHSQAR